MTFMAECFWPGVTAELVATRVRDASRAAPAGGVARSLGAILVPEDEIALFLLEAPSLAAATGLALHAAIPFERILEVVRLDPTARGRSAR
jgi:hypothetical protein